MTKTYTKRTPAEKLAIVNSRFRSGDLEKLVTKTGAKKPVVSKTIAGTSINEKVLNVAFDMFRNRKPNYEVLDSFYNRK